MSKVDKILKDLICRHSEPYMGCKVCFIKLENCGIMKVKSAIADEIKKLMKPNIWPILIRDKYIRDKYTGKETEVLSNTYEIVNNEHNQAITEVLRLFGE